MNLIFAQLRVLFEHKWFMTSVLPDTDIFFVWWAIRDILLGKTKDPIDIDCTGIWDPDSLRNYIDKYDNNNIDRFRTEKFWTISLIKHQNDKEYIYELTPFRTEWTYTDVRHPDDLERSESLLIDSNRRDFTINCIYRFWLGQEWKTSSTRTVPTIEQGLKHNDPLLIEDTLILRDHQQIDSFDKTKIQQLLDTAIIVDDSKSSWTQLSIIFDPHGWIESLLERVIVTVWDPIQRFEEDALRVMRWARFVISLNENLPWAELQNSWFDFRKKTREAMKSSSHLVKNVSFERINQELVKVFQWNNPFGYISVLWDLWLIEWLFPALYNCIWNVQPSRHHPFDTFAHTLLTLHALQWLNQDYLVRFAMLLHDVWKPEQYEFMEKAIEANPENPDRSWFEHHSDISVEHARKELKRLCFPKKSIDTISRYIKQHHRPWEILDGNPKNREKKLRKLLSDWWLEQVHNLIDIAIADRLGQLNPIQPPAIQELIDMKTQVTTLFESEWRFTMKDLAVNGSWIMKNFWVEAGPELWKLLEKTFEWVLWDINERNSEWPIKKFLKNLIK